MPQNDTLKRYLDAGIAFTQMTRSRAESIVKDLVKAGEVQRDQTQERVDELMDRSRKNTEQLLELVRAEIRQQFSAMGLATKEDIDRIEARLDAKGTPRASGLIVPTGTATKSTAKKASKNMAPVVKKAPAKKATASKASAKKAPAKKTAGTSKKA
jgi:polyhydroxyalkanoate synthesis regulator phasin